MPSIAKFDVWKNGAGTNYNVPIQVVTSSLGTNLGTTVSSTSDRTQDQPSWAFASTTTTWTDMPLNQLQLTITPKFSTSIIKLGLAITMNNGTNNNAAGVRVRRGTTIVFRPLINNVGPVSTFFTSTGGASWAQFFYEFYDSPATTSSITYNLQYRTYSGATAYWFGGSVPGDYAGANYFTATEIAQ